MLINFLQIKSFSDNSLVVRRIGLWQMMRLKKALPFHLTLSCRCGCDWRPRCSRRESHTCSYLCHTNWFLLKRKSSLPYYYLLTMMSRPVVHRNLVVSSPCSVCKNKSSSYISVPIDAPHSVDQLLSTLWANCQFDATLSVSVVGWWLPLLSQLVLYPRAAVQSLSYHYSPVQIHRQVPE